MDPASPSNRGRRAASLGVGRDARRRHRPGWAAVGFGLLMLLAGCPGSAPPDDPAVPATSPPVSVGESKGHAPPPAGAADEPYEAPHVPVDPVALNGPIFEGWAAPRWALVITGEQNGYLEPCGCAGRENQKGGLMRRYSLLAQQRAAGWPLVALDLGGHVRRFGPQAEIKFQETVQALSRMNYAATGLGTADLRLSPDALLTASTTAADGGSLFVAANWRLTIDDTFTVSHRVIELAGVRVGVTAVLGDEARAQLPSTSDLEARPAAEALAELVPALTAASDVQVLLSYATREESTALARQFPQFEVVVTAGGAEEPPYQPEPLDGQDTLLVEVGHKGMYAAAIGWYDDTERPWRFQRVPIDARFPDAPEMRDLLGDYQEQLRLSGLEALTGAPIVHPRHDAKFPGSGEFAGSARCAECHKKAFAKWQTSGHARALESLTKLDPPRQFDPECISCHATGWEPQKYVPYVSGFMSEAQTPALAGNSCENCHGPAAEHAAIEESRSARQLGRRDQLRGLLKLTKATAGDQVCRQCHDHDNSPEFDFDKYWPKVEHPGKD